MTGHIHSQASIADMGQRARRAAETLAALPSASKKRALRLAATALRDGSRAILDANRVDMDRARTAGLSAAMLDRLRLDTARLEGVADGVDAVAALADPVGAVID